MYDFDSDYSQTYTETCEDCGNKIEVSTQRDNNPEYQTDVYVKCQCGASVQFTLPVN